MICRPVYWRQSTETFLENPKDRKVITMVQINVTVEYQGKNYLTNVITSRETSEEEIFRLALEQVKQQWTK